MRHPRAAATALDYSYAADDFRPLGLQLFRDKVKPTALPQRVAAGGTIDARAPHMTPAANETARETFALREQREGNRYLWDFDICSLTLGNFNYRKMSLVRDYGTLIDEETGSEVFDSVFSVHPRQVDEETPAAVRLEDLWPIVSTDATQRDAVALARSGRSYIVQGPPGTGKSQTITNLIADFVARDKRVLFVCEKRAALDVVFHRLRQRGIDELCSLIHDSQSDKKAFIQNLKQTYEAWLAQPDGAERAEAERAQLAKRIRQDLEPLVRFDSVMTSAPDYVGTSVRDLVETLAESRDDEPDIDARSMERLPTFDVWRRHADIAQRLSATLNEVCGVDALASHPFRSLSPQLIRAERPLESLYQLTDRIESIVDTIERRLDESALPAEHRDTLGDVEHIVAFAQKAAALAERNQLALLDEASALANDLARAARALEAAQAALESARKKTAHWRDKLEAADVEAALAVAASSERSIFRFLSGAWRRLKKTLDARYEFAAHAVRPAPSQILKDLQAEYAAQDVVARELAQGSTQFGAPPDALSAETRALREQAKSSPTLAALLARLQQPQANALVGNLSALAPAVRELLESLPRLVATSPDMTVQELGELVRDLREEADVLPDLLPVLTELAGSHEDFIGALRSFALTPRALGAGSARKSLEILHRIERWLPRFDGRLLEHLATRIASLDREWLEANATVIRSRARRLFREHAQLSTTSVTQLDNDQRTLKKRYSTGRRELEHEFGKSMRYKSIRDLAAGDSGIVMRDLKPIWLMSPLSVSDTLPLDTSLFDVVIFDEASQIPMEEAVPALYRAPQIIVVGDEMQLPPTNFFTATRADENSEIEVEDDGERVAIALDADSLLTQGARNLPSTMLAWHYRSRSESLIGFSNAAFYGGNLFTIPDRELPAPQQATLHVRLRSDAATHVQALLTRPLSFHLMEASPYDNRTNAGEAAYVAELVRELLQAGTKLSIGVVAFSEAQQTEIESALTDLADADPAFSALLEEAYVREENDQFCGLFVKNLENVQGDERDIVILSICYGPDAQGRMLMNFGPINQRGGEKRLNVIFSRARHHMAVVSSIRHGAITNDYNDGAAALKRFLQYAECASAGEGRAAQGVLEALNPLKRRSGSSGRSGDTIAQQIGVALRERGYVVDEDVGQSRFRCDLAIRRDDERAYRLGVLIDTEEHYENRDVAERYVTRPEVLRTFGWTVVLILMGDWYREPDRVLERIERRLRGEAEAAEDLPLDSLPRPPPEPAQPPPVTPREEPVTAPARASTGNVRRCEFVEGRSSKFWEIARNDTVLTICYGRIGTQGQSLTKSFDTPQRAEQELAKLLGEKLRKGYREVPPA
jgi:predicted DNA-binding WGR domain protein